MVEVVEVEGGGVWRRYWKENEWGKETKEVEGD